MIKLGKKKKICDDVAWSPSCLILNEHMKHALRELEGPWRLLHPFEDKHLEYAHTR
jgi:hypothetical protein